MKIFYCNVHIKNGSDVTVRSVNCVRCKQNCVYKQNACDKNTSEVQKFKIVIDKENKCKSMGQRNIARKHNKSTTEGYNNHDLILTHKRVLHIKLRNNKNPTLRKYFKDYC